MLKYIRNRKTNYAALLVSEAISFAPCTEVCPDALEMTTVRHDGSATPTTFQYIFSTCILISLGLD